MRSDRRAGKQIRLLANVVASGLVLVLCAACSPVTPVPLPQELETPPALGTLRQQAAGATAEGFAVGIEVEQSRYDSTEPINLLFTLTNTTGDAVSFLSWHLPFNGLDSDMFRVWNGNQRAKYLGPVVKRAPPTADDYLTLAAGESMTTTVPLDEYYAIGAAGEYTVEFVSAIYDAGTQTPADRAESELMSPQPLRTGPVGFTVAAGRRLAPTAKMTPGYKNCSDSQKSALNGALDAAEVMATNARNTFINTLAADQPKAVRYSTWFGAHTSARYATALIHFAAIKSAFSNKTVSINCSCSSDLQNAYAYVYPSSPYEIYVCGAFWRASLTGTDSRAGTLIHEMSHFQVVSGNTDHVYGQGGCQWLASSDPDKATHNADSHEYFAENTPALAMGTNPPAPITAWVGVEVAGINSHQKATWCPKGSFLVSFDLDGNRAYSTYDSPVVRQAQCARPAANSQWGACAWVPVGQAGINSHVQSPIWCPAGRYLVGLDLDGAGNISDKSSPIIGGAQCCTLAGASQISWDSSYWIEVGARASHQSGTAWCLPGAYLTQVDQDQWGADLAPDGYDAPIVGQARCSRPAQ